MLDFVKCLCLHELGCKPVFLPEKIPWTEEPGRESGTTEHWAHTHGELHWLVLNDKPTLYSQDKFHFNVLKVKVAQSCPTLCDPMDDTVHGILQARILEPFPSPGDLPKAGIEPRSHALQVDSLLTEPQGKSKNTGVGSLSLFSRGTSQTKTRTRVSCIVGGFFTSWPTQEAQW